jgi:small conductance mechanosensitive channel
MNDLDQLWTLVQQWLALYGLRIPVALLILLVGRWLARSISRAQTRVLERHAQDPVLTGFLRHLTYWALLTAVVVAAIGQLGINVASFLAILGAAGLAVGLALKDSLSNFAAGVMLVIFRPFCIGDYVQAGGTAGTVDVINIFNTVMRTPDNQRIIVPNSLIINDVITNVTANPTRRLDLVFGIAYGDDTARAKEILQGLLNEEGRILEDPAPVIAVAELADSSVNIVCRPWVKTEEYWAVRFDLIERAKRAFDEAGISIPFPQRDVHLHQVEQAA